MLSFRTRHLSVSTAIAFFLTYILVLFICTTSLIIFFFFPHLEKKLPKKILSKDKRTVKYHSFCTVSCKWKSDKFTPSSQCNTSDLLAFTPLSKPGLSKHGRAGQTAVSLHLQHSTQEFWCTEITSVCCTKIQAGENRANVLDICNYICLFVYRCKLILKAFLKSLSDTY